MDWSCFYGSRDCHWQQKLAYAWWHICILYIYGLGAGMSWAWLGLASRLEFMLYIHI
jgi:hypothetical protein